jgi:hypothetical protein
LVGPGPTWHRLPLKSRTASYACFCQFLHGLIDFSKLNVGTGLILIE